MRISLLIIGLCYSLNLFAQEKKQITLEDIFTKSVFRSDMVAGFRSMKNGTCYSEINEKGDLQQVRFSDGEVEKIIAPLHELEFDRHTLKVDDYAFSDDESKLLLFCESENIYRRSVLNRVYVYDIRNGSLALVNEDKILHASFSPKGDLVAYVRQNNLWLFNPQTNETWSVTDDGSENILNGNCDWVYEEEFQFTRAYEWARVN